MVQVNPFFGPLGTKAHEGDNNYRSYVDVNQNAYDENKRRVYNDCAEVYDQQRFSGITGRLYAELSENAVCELLGPQCSAKVLDIGTGTGRLALALASRGAEVTAIDIAEKMLHETQKKAERAHLSISLIHGNAQSMPLQSESFDVVICTRFLHILPDDRHGTFLREMLRVLRPGGTLIVEYNNVIPHYVENARSKGETRVHWPEQFRAELKGLDIVEMRGLMPPGLGRIASLSRPLAWKVSKWTCRPPLAYMCRQILIKAVKPPVIEG